MCAAEPVSRFAVSDPVRDDVFEFRSVCRVPFTPLPPAYTKKTDESSGGRRLNSMFIIAGSNPSTAEPSSFALDNRRDKGRFATAHVASTSIISCD